MPKDSPLVTTTVEPASPPLSNPFNGIYDLPEAARYLKASQHGSTIYPVSAAKMIRWIRKGIASPNLAEADEDSDHRHTSPTTVTPAPSVIPACLESRPPTPEPTPAPQPSATQLTTPNKRTHVLLK